MTKKIKHKIYVFGNDRYIIDAVDVSDPYLPEDPYIGAYEVFAEPFTGNKRRYVNAQVLKDQGLLVGLVHSFLIDILGGNIDHMVSVLKLYIKIENAPKFEEVTNILLAAGQLQKITGDTENC